MERTYTRPAAVRPTVLPVTLLLALAAVACSRERRDTVAVTHRLAEEATDEPQAAGARIVALDGVVHNVIATPVGDFAYPRNGASPAIEVAADGSIDLPLVCPPRLAGNDVLLTAALAGSSWFEGAHCPSDRSAPLRFRIARLTPHETVRPIVVVTGVPTAPLKSRPLGIGPAAVLRVALGIVSAGGTPVRFRIFARGPGLPLHTVLDRVVEPAQRAEDRGWVETEVPLGVLAASAHGAIRLAFEARAAGPPAWPVQPVWGDPIVFDTTAELRRPNVVLISLDTLRADRLGAYGARRPTSPTLDRLATGGTLFETAIAAAPWTLPSHLTMLTGVYPCVHGRVTSAIFQRPPEGVQTLPELLRVHGYATAAFTEDGYILPEVFQPGFDRFRYEASTEDGVEHTVGEARRWIVDHARWPFFVFLHTYQMHWPYQSRPPFHGMFTQTGATAEAAELDDYDAALRYADDTLGSLFTTLEQAGIADRTLVIVTSDHGEAFREHGTIRHGNAMYEEVLRVPFIWHAPGLVAAGQRVRALVGLIDVAPTVLDLVGLPIPELVQGVSLAPLLRPHGDAPATGRVLFAENSWELPYSIIARTDAWKAFYDTDGTTRVYALATDPDERDPTSGHDYVSAAATARARFDEDCERRRKTAGVGAPPPPSVMPAPADGEREQRLRALGYVQ